jgi:hypothetical protein
VHRIVSGAPRGPRAQRSALPGKERNRALFMSGGVLDCLVRHPTQGKNCLPNEDPMAPSCLGDIKGTPRRMEHYSIEHPKMPRLCNHAIRSSCLRFQHFLSCKLPAPCFCAHVLTCVRVIAVILACVSFPPLLLCSCCDQLCKGERLQLVEIPHKWENNYKEENRGIQVDHWIT